MTRYYVEFEISSVEGMRRPSVLVDAAEQTHAVMASMIKLVATGGFDEKTETLISLTLSIAH